MKHLITTNEPRTIGIFLGLIPIVDSGSWLTPATFEVEDQDYETFVLLTQEAQVPANTWHSRPAK